MIDTYKILLDAALEGTIMSTLRHGSTDTASMIQDVVADLTLRYGQPSEADVLSVGIALGEKLSGMAADADATFAGHALTFTDGEDDDDAFDVRVDGPIRISYMIVWGEVSMIPVTPFAGVR